LGPTIGRCTDQEISTLSKGVERDQQSKRTDYSKTFGQSLSLGRNYRYNKVALVSLFKKGIHLELAQKLVKIGQLRNLYSLED